MVIEPLHPTHRVDGFACTDSPDLASDLGRFHADSAYVVGQRVLVNSIDGQVVGYLSLTDTEMSIDGYTLHCMFISRMAVDDARRRNGADASFLFQHALKCMGPAEKFSGRKYQALLIQPRGNDRIREAAQRLGFVEAGDGYWALLVL